MRKPSKRSFRQDLFRSVNTSEPRCVTPGRRPSSVALDPSMSVVVQYTHTYTLT